jgi:hypothetical protein
VRDVDHTHDADSRPTARRTDSNRRGRDEHDLTDEAIARVYRIYIGDPATGAPYEWTRPFSKTYSDRSAEAVVRQVGPATFKLREPFKYVDDGRRFDVPMEDISDFASVPTFLTWLIPRYGRHTLAALLLDHLQKHRSDRGKGTDESDPERVTSEEADTIFRVAMHYSRVPFVRRWVMWAAVGLRTVFTGGIPGKVAVGLWLCDGESAGDRTHGGNQTAKNKEQPWES